MDWNYNLEQCPTNAVVWFLSEPDNLLLPQAEYLGTAVKKSNGELTRGECLFGDPEYFYRSKIVAWKYIDITLLQVFSKWCEKECINYEYIDESSEKIVLDFVNMRGKLGNEDN